MTTAFSYIRFSSEKQQLGDSLRRQLKLAEEYAGAHNLVLDSHSYRDLGVSAFKGKNFIEGKLGTFLQAVDDGIVPKNAYLLVESLDRLSRAQVDVALELFLSIIRRGITIITLMDGQTYSSERIKQDKGMSLIISLTYMMRAHEESATKSTRVKAAWDNNRKDWRPGSPLISRRGPAWLKASPDGTLWIEVPAKVLTVRRIYRMAGEEGLGQVNIVRKLNDPANPTPVMEDAKQWTQGVIGALLRNPAVMGRFTQKRGGTQVIENYFPAIVPRDQWLAVQDAIKDRRSTGGTKGENVNNLFSGMSFCFYCGGRTRFVPTSKGHAYIHCLKAYSNAGCSARPFPYKVAETAILDRLINKQHRDTRGRLFKNAPDESAVMKGSIEQLKKQQAQLIKLAMAAPDVSAVAVELNKVQGEIDELERALKDTSKVPITEAEIKESEDLFKHHQELLSQGGAELNELRRRMQVSLRRQLQRVEFAPDFMESDRTHELEQMQSHAVEFVSDAPNFLIQLTYTGGSVRQVEADPWVTTRSQAKRKSRTSRKATVAI
ncbi:MAG: recombinase family protein [Burkholderiales bacterium]